MELEVENDIFNDKDDNFTSAGAKSKPKID